MCRYASFIVCKDFKVFFGSKSDSHSDIRAEHKLPDNNCGEIKNVQVEYIPAGSRFSRDMKQWKFVIDQDQLPSWWDNEEAQMACWAALPKLAKAREPKPTKKVAIPKGYELAPDNHVLRKYIDMGPCRENGTGIKDNENGVKTPYGFQWVFGWDGDLVEKAKRSINAEYFGYFIRPKVKQLQSKRNRVTIRIGGVPRRITIPKGYERMNPDTLVTLEDMVYNKDEGKFIPRQAWTNGMTAKMFHCAIRKVK